jgi:hypothetical protein
VRRRIICFNGHYYTPFPGKINPFLEYLFIFFESCRNFQISCGFFGFIFVYFSKFDLQKYAFLNE